MEDNKTFTGLVAAHNCPEWAVIRDSGAFSNMKLSVNKHVPHCEMCSNLAINKVVSKGKK